MVSKISSNCGAACLLNNHFSISIPTLAQYYNMQSVAKEDLKAPFGERGQVTKENQKQTVYSAL